MTWSISPWSQLSTMERAPSPENISANSSLRILGTLMVATEWQTSGLRLALSSVMSPSMMATGPLQSQTMAPLLRSSSSVTSSRSLPAQDRQLNSLLLPRPRKSCAVVLMRASERWRPSWQLPHRFPYSTFMDEFNVYVGLGTHTQPLSSQTSDAAQNQPLNPQACLFLTGLKRVLFTQISGVIAAERYVVGLPSCLETLPNQPLFKHICGVCYKWMHQLWPCEQPTPSYSLDCWHTPIYFLVQQMHEESFCRCNSLWCVRSHVQANHQTSPHAMPHLPSESVQWQQ